MEQLIPIINKLQDVFAQVKIGASEREPIDLPQIAVVGSQSVGKSSVLENIVGRDFLPRGSDIVTRRPLVLQLINLRDFNENMKEEKDPGEVSAASSSSSASASRSPDAPWGEFLHKRGRKYFDFNEIRKEIEAETDRIAPSKAISHEPINLKIFSPDVLNLTLVDLPGLTKVPVGNQPKDIERQIKKLVRSFISKPKCLILAVSAATSDLATSDALQFAGQMDPKGVRTLGVLTKIDLMDEGTDALNMLMGKTIPLQLGYVGVINRSQQNIMDGLSIKDGAKKEEMFFSRHRVYRSVAHVMGTPYLCKKLNQILINHIKHTLPSLKKQINDHVMDLLQEVEGYGEPLSAQEQNKGALLLKLISKFSDNFAKSIAGNGIDVLRKHGPGMAGKDPSMSMGMSFGMGMGMGLSGSAGTGLTATGARDLFGGARMLYIFRTEFQHALNNIKPFQDLNDDFILNSMRNASGVRTSLFVPEMCFENLVKIQIEKLRRPCIQCVEMVYTELKRLSAQCQTPELGRFNKFKDALTQCVHAMLKKHLEPCRTFVNQLIDIELAYINTNHPDFISVDDVFNERVNHAQSKRKGKLQRGARGARDRDRDRERDKPVSHEAVSADPSPAASSSKTAATDHHAIAREHGRRSGEREATGSGAGNAAHGGQSGGGGWFGFQRGKTSQHESSSKTSASVSASQAGNGVAAPRERPPSSASQSALDESNPFHQSGRAHGQGNRHKIARESPYAHSSSGLGAYGHGHGHGHGHSRITQRESIELRIIKRFIESYFNIVKKHIADIVPKSVMLMLVNASKERMAQELSLTLYREDQFKTLLSENPEIARKRKEANELLEVMKKSLDIINSISDTKLIE